MVREVEKIWNHELITLKLLDSHLFNLNKILLPIYEIWGPHKNNEHRSIIFCLNLPRHLHAALELGK